jgi:GLPGLI family protein
VPLTLINIPFRTINHTRPSQGVLLPQLENQMVITKTMKRILLILGIVTSLAAAQVVFAQTEGVISYETKINVHRNLPADRQEMKNMIPEFRVVQDLLVFNANESLHKPVIEDEDEDFDNGGGMRMRFARPQNETYVNQEKAKRVLLQDFMGKKYLIEDSLSVMPWKFGTETKEINGYACKQASYYNEDRKQNIVAWYTDRLRPFLGPESFNTLPGGVLQVDINDGERVITAKNIELRPLKKNELKEPTSGTKTTQAEFRKMMNEQMERMRANGANVMIRN